MNKTDLMIKFLRSRFLNRRPFLLSHMITSNCNANCDFCYWKKRFKNELTLEEIKMLYQEAKKKGFEVLTIWGGEPLLRNDIGEILKIAKEYGFYIQLFSNGFFLPQKAKEIAKYIDSLIISLDNIGEKHDRARRCRGLFHNLERGVDIFNEYKLPSTKVYFNCCLTRQNWPEIKKMLDFGSSKQTQISFDDIIVSRITKHLKLEQKDLAEIFRIIKRYKQLGYPIVNSFFHLNHIIQGKTLPSCIYTNICLTIGPAGDINPVCKSFVRSEWNVRKDHLNFLDTKEFHDYQSKASQCRFRCNDLASVEFYYLWKLNPESLLNLIKYS